MDCLPEDVLEIIGSFDILIKHKLSLVCKFFSKIFKTKYIYIYNKLNISLEDICKIDDLDFMVVDIDWYKLKDHFTFSLLDDKCKNGMNIFINYPQYVETKFGYDAEIGIARISQSLQSRKIKFVILPGCYTKFTLPSDDGYILHNVVNNFVRSELVASSRIISTVDHISFTDISICSGDHNKINHYVDRFPNVKSICYNHVDISKINAANNGRNDMMNTIQHLKVDLHDVNTYSSLNLDKYNNLTSLRINYIPEIILNNNVYDSLTTLSMHVSEENCYIIQKMKNLVNLCLTICSPARFGFCLRINNTKLKTLRITYEYDWKIVPTSTSNSFHKLILEGIKLDSLYINNTLNINLVVHIGEECLESTKILNIYGKIEKIERLSLHKIKSINVDIIDLVDILAIESIRVGGYEELEIIHRILEKLCLENTIKYIIFVSILTPHFANIHDKYPWIEDIFYGYCYMPYNELEKVLGYETVEI